MTHDLDARTALATAMADCLEWDIDPVVMDLTDQILARLFLHGYVVLEIPETIARAIEREAG